MSFLIMEKGERFILKTFNGATTPSKECEEKENYWKLIQEEGTVVNFADDLGFPYKNRVLLQFDCDVKARGLECHNEKPNSLWILKTDLKEIR
ncbi:hypothetical protein [Pontibacter burrus]|uniref:Uncharacterized protein n=1 Tax=Pontibacter burrus TaxID=2704466 RepID=A0A6B3LME1_9BACT|nr:hypothetical protein [Pontibacter burrus]NEM98082.1 hypothetical protein [Pontibacter burrus]